MALFHKKECLMKVQSKLKRSVVGNRQTRLRELTLFEQLRYCGLKPPVSEYKFLEDRRFKFDYAYPEVKLAIEIEGGIYFVTGGHKSIQGLQRDLEKYNLATQNGWRILRYTPEQSVGIAASRQIRATVDLIMATYPQDKCPTGILLHSI